VATKSQTRMVTKASLRQYLTDTITEIRYNKQQCMKHRERGLTRELCESLREDIARYRAKELELYRLGETFGITQAELETACDELLRSPEWQPYVKEKTT